MMESKVIRQAIPLLLLFVLIALPMRTVATPLFNDVRVENSEVDLLVQSSATISWQLLEQANVSFFICDLKGNIVKTLLENEPLESGSQTVQWDGLNDYGHPCANGIYIPIIKCLSRRKGAFVYNPTALQWGENVPARDLNYDTNNETVTFSVDRPTFGRLRVGLKDGGPVYKTLAAWQLFEPNQHVVQWNGKDKENYHSVMTNEKISFSFDAFSLPSNAIVVRGSSDSADLAGQQYKTFPIHPPASNQLSYFSLNTGSHNGEPKLATKWLKSKQKKDQLTLKGKATCRVSFADSSKRAATLMGGSELILYIDDQYVVEVPVDSLPATIGFDSHQYKNGPHLITINLLTTDDRAGIHIQKAIINN